MELFKFANRVIDAEFGRFLAGRNDLKIIKADDRSFLLVKAKRLEANKQFINVFVLQFQDLQIGLRVSDFAYNVVKLRRPRAAPNISGSKSSLFIFKKKATSGSFSEKLKSTHFVRTVNAGFAVFGKLFEQLPAKGSFAGGGSCADDVKSGTEILLGINIFEAREPIGVVFEMVYIGFKLMSEIIRNVQRFGRVRFASPIDMLLFHEGEHFRHGFFSPSRADR